MRKKPPQHHTRRFLPKKAQSLAESYDPSFASGDPPSEKGPEAVRGSSGPADATNVTPDPARDTLGVPKPREVCNTPAPFNAILWCPLCGLPLADDGSCMPCKAQFVNIDADVADRVNFAAPPEGDAEPPAGPPRYREYWEVDELGRAIMCFKSRTTGWMVWLACFINYLDHFGDKLTRFPYWFCEQRFGARTVQILADLTDDQMKERAAHIPGRITTEHQRRYDSDTFQREYFWVWMDSHAPWQTREERKAVIVSRHRRFGCGDPECRKRHRSPQK
jgi:hypothetical protein